MQENKVKVRLDNYGLPISCLQCGNVCLHQYERLDQGKEAIYCDLCVEVFRPGLITKPIEDWICSECNKRREINRDIATSLDWFYRR